MTMEYLFANFLGAPEVYDEAQAFWQSLCQRVLVRHGQSDVWEPLPQELSGEGTPLRDGNPIYSLVNRNQLKSVVIIQQDPRINSKWEMAAWVNMFGDEFSEPRPIDELVFTCNLTQQSATTFENLFETWIQSTCRVQDIQEKIKMLIGY